MTACSARPLGGDQRACVACRLVWDVNDPEPPVCPRASREAPSASGYTSDRVFDGKRPLSAERVARLKERHALRLPYASALPFPRR